MEPQVIAAIISGSIGAFAGISRALGNFNKFYQKVGSERFIHENKELVSFLKPWIKKGNIEIMQHGYSHNYYLKSGQKYYDATEQNKSIIDKFNFCGEFNYPDYELLNKKTKNGKEYLEDLFDSKIFNFVPPSNQINKMGIKSLINNKLNMSGLVGYRYDRELSLKGYQAFLKRVFFKIKYTNITYSKVLDYGLHKELAALSITPTTNFDSLQKQLSFRIDRKENIQLATHYWELDQDLRKIFFKIITDLRTNYSFALLKEIL